jgi:hypothetical protein
MQTTAVLHNLESSIQNQLALVTDPAIEAGGRAVLNSIHPALREAAMEIVNQAADEVRAQLPGHRVEVVIADGEPTLRITADESTAPPVEGDFDARITLRLPDSIKDIVERAASDSGDSVNAWVVKTLAGRASSGSRSSRRRVSETFDI